jgi:hypothetical protein
MSGLTSPEARRVQSLSAGRSVAHWFSREGLSRVLRTRGNCIYIGKTLHGRVIDNHFARCDLVWSWRGGDQTRCDHDSPAWPEIMLLSSPPFRAQSSHSDIPPVSGDSVEDDVTSRSATLGSSHQNNSDKYCIYLRFYVSAPPGPPAS